MRSDAELYFSKSDEEQFKHKLVGMDNLVTNMCVDLKRIIPLNEWVSSLFELDLGYGL